MNIQVKFNCGEFFTHFSRVMPLFDHQNCYMFGFQMITCELNVRLKFAVACKQGRKLLQILASSECNILIYLLYGLINFCKYQPALPEISQSRTGGQATFSNSGDCFLVKRGRKNVQKTSNKQLTVIDDQRAAEYSKSRKLCNLNSLVDLLNLILI